MCDRVADCKENEDERHCSNFYNLLNQSQLCALIHFKDLGKKCAVYNKSEIQHKACINPLTSLNTLTFDFIHQNNHQQNESSEEMSSNSYCIYEPTSCGLMDGNPNGGNLISCEDHILNVQVSIVYHGGMFVMVRWNVQEEWMRKNVTGQYAQECLCAEIQAYVYLLRAYVIIYLIAIIMMMKTTALSRQSYTNVLYIVYVPNSHCFVTAWISRLVPV